MARLFRESFVLLGSQDLAPKGNWPGKKYLLSLRSYNNNIDDDDDDDDNTKRKWEHKMKT